MLKVWFYRQTVLLVLTILVAFDFIGVYLRASAVEKA
jgi:hypothetical protein